MLLRTGQQITAKVRQGKGAREVSVEQPTGDRRHWRNRLLDCLDAAGLAALYRLVTARSERARVVGQVTLTPTGIPAHTGREVRQHLREAISALAMVFLKAFSLCRHDLWTTS